MRRRSLRVLIAADSALMRAGLARLLEDADICVVAEAADCGELKRKAAGHKPDVAVWALSAVPCRSTLPDLPVLVLAQSVDLTVAMGLLDASPAGVGYLLEHRVPDVGRFVSALREVAGGGSVLDPAVVAQVLDRRARRNTLTPREREVLELMAQGRSNRAIAETAFLSERAVERHVTGIFEKLRLPQSSGTHRRVLAVLSHLQANGATV
jgi:DNA-binding NarL/FixJ family response regulator